MKKQYVTPKAERFVFDYESNVVASCGSVKDGRSPDHPSYNACFTHNGSDMSTRNHKKKCNGKAK